MQPFEPHVMGPEEAEPLDGLGHLRGMSVGSPHPEARRQLGLNIPFTQQVVDGNRQHLAQLHDLGVGGAPLALLDGYQRGAREARRSATCACVSFARLRASASRSPS